MAKPVDRDALRDKRKARAPGAGRRNRKRQVAGRGQPAAAQPPSQTRCFDTFSGTGVQAAFQLGAGRPRAPRRDRRAAGEGPAAETSSRSCSPEAALSAARGGAAQRAPSEAEGDAAPGRSARPGLPPHTRRRPAAQFRPGQRRGWPPPRPAHSGVQSSGARSSVQRVLRDPQAAPGKLLQAADRNAASGTGGSSRPPARSSDSSCRAAIDHRQQGGHGAAISHPEAAITSAALPRRRAVTRTGSRARRDDAGHQLVGRGGAATAPQRRTQPSGCALGPGAAARSPRAGRGRQRPVACDSRTATHLRRARSSGPSSLLCDHPPPPAAASIPVEPGGDVLVSLIPSTPGDLPLAAGRRGRSADQRPVPSAARAATKASSRAEAIRRARLQPAARRRRAVDAASSSGAERRGGAGANEIATFRGDPVHPGGEACAPGGSGEALAQSCDHHLLPRGQRRSASAPAVGSVATRPQHPAAGSESCAT